MKEEYVQVELEVMAFDTEDIIITSGGDPNEGELD